MTVNELKILCDEIIAKGKGDVKVCFDSEAVRFNCHIIDIERGFLELESNGSAIDALIFTWSNKDYKEYYER
jgi:hypothetical protein